MFYLKNEKNNEEPITITETIQSGGCQPGELGSISLEISPADGDYTFEWDHGATTSDLSDLDPGEYTVTVTDTNTGCSEIDRKSTRLNSSHVAISYAVFCLNKKKKTIT